MTDERIIAYLLEELRPEEAERFEEECFAAESWPEGLRAVEEELIEDYLRDALTTERRRRFESHYLTTAARRERVREAAALLRHADEAAGATAGATAGREGPAAHAPTPSPTLLEKLRAFWGGASLAPRAAVALALLAFVAAAVWLYTRERTPHLVPLTLVASSSDRATGARPAVVALPPGADALRATLVLPAGQAPATRYRVELSGERWALEAPEVISQDARSVTVLIETASLKQRDSYVLKLYAVGADGIERRVSGSYFFDVE